MDYDHLRALWHKALDGAGLLPFPPWPRETVDLGRMSRTYRITVAPRGVQRAGAFHVTAGLNWRCSGFATTAGFVVRSFLACASTT